MIKIFPIEDNAFLKQKTLCGDQDCAPFSHSHLITQWRLTVR